MTQLDLTRDVRSIKDGLRKVGAVQAIDLASTWTDSFDGIRQHLLNIQPRIIHIRGGREEQSAFYLKSRNGELARVPDADIRTLFSLLRNEVRLVILDRAMSQAETVAVREASHCTITIHPETPPDIAIEYLTSFYRHIGQGATVRTAHNLALISFQDEQACHLLVSLDAASDCDPSTLRFVEPPLQQDDESKLRFVQLEMATDKCLWEEMRRFCSPQVSPYHPLSGQPWFNQTYSVAPKSEYAFGSHQLANSYLPDNQLDSETRVADPVLECTIINQGDTSMVLSRIGFRVVNAWNAAKAAPVVFKISSFDAYELAVRDFVVGEDQTLRLPEPVFVSPKGTYRFRLRLKDYAKGAKANETVIRLIAIANHDIYVSDEIYLGLMWLGDSDRMHD